MSGPKRFRHSSTFYRKVNEIIGKKHAVDLANTLPSTSSNQEKSDGVPGPTYHDETINESLGNCVNELDSIFHAETEDDSTDLPHETPNFDDDAPSDSEHDEDSINLCLKEKIHQWALKHQITHIALNGLIEILRENRRMNYLPKDSRSLLQTPRSTSIVPMGNGQYWYNGLKNCLQEVLTPLTMLPTSISLTFNMDGLPIAKSAKLEFWPILCKIKDIDVCPLVVAIYLGNTKPPVNDFLRPFVNELLSLLTDGLLIKNTLIDVKSRCFVCDTPARSFIKGTVGFNSYHGCMKCVVIGEYDRRGRHMSYVRTDMPLRTDDSFRNRSDPDHHKEKSIIEDLPIDLVNDFTIADSLHLLDLGIMKRCLLGWINGSFNFRTKWSTREVQNISRMLMVIKSTTPAEVHQGRFRELDTVHFWKAAEFKNFLLYYGPVVLKEHLSFEVYQHFLTLFCAITICSCNNYNSYLQIAHKLLENYIEKFAEIYGEDSISSNVHNLCHIVHDVSRFGPLPTLSAYPFESMLFRIKNLIRKGDQPLAQVANRLQELSKFPIDHSKNSATYPTVKYERVLQSGEKVFTDVNIKKNCFLSSRNIKDKWFLTTDNDIIEMLYATSIQGEIKITGNIIKNKCDFFERPFNSSRINIYTTLCDFETEELKECQLNCVKCKLISLICQNKMVFIPILSTIS